MIRYSLRCAAGHDFEAWFRASAAFDEQRAAGSVGCPVCGSAEVAKAPMAPAVQGERGGGLAGPASPAEAALAGLRRQIERSSDDVGRDFPAEARRIHSGEADKRAIRGEASREEARALRDEGIPVLPLPWRRRGDG